MDQRVSVEAPFALEIQSDTRTYRLHIDGLRAIAILGVVLYHLKLIPAHNFFAVSGGFIGVDVFFVISGFLISNIIFTEAAESQFSFLNFYARRARRILPAFFLVCGLTMLAGLFVLHPFEYARLSRSFLAALGFSANIYFYVTSNYFAPSATELPLLHLWSLGIEEQFYFIFPAFVLVAYSFGRRSPLAAITALGGASLLIAQHQLQANPTAAFYLLPGRAFELLIGSLIAFPGVWKTRSANVAQLVALAGLLMIGWSYHFLNVATRFPGQTALPACIGTALVIWSGECRPTLATRLLSVSPAVQIGRWSYSLYLYHWPVLFFATRLLTDWQPEAIGLSVLGVSMLLAWLTYQFVETPMRHSRLPPRRSLGFAGLGIMIALGAGVFVIGTDGLAWRVDAKVKYYTSFLTYRNVQQFRADTCYYGHQTGFPSLNSQCLASSSKPIAVIWGDSGIAQYASQLDKAFDAHGMTMRQATASACPPAIEIDIPTRPHCLDFNRQTLRSILALHPAMVVLGAAWSTQTEIYDHVEKTIDVLQAAGIRVVVLGLGPAYRIPVPTLLADRYSVDNPNLFSGDDLARPWALTTDDMFRARVALHSPAKYISIIRAVCPNEECPLLADGIPAHFDVFHVTEPGSKLFVSKFSEQIFK